MYEHSMGQSARALAATIEGRIRAQITLHPFATIVGAIGVGVLLARAPRGAVSRMLLLAGARFVAGNLVASVLAPGEVGV